MSSGPIGLLGGTFDPVHVGHLRAAIECRERLGLARLDLLPSADPPLKAVPKVTAEQRLEMVRLAVATIPGIGVDGRELLRPGTSYTVDTLAGWRLEYGDQQSLVFIVGDDILPDLARWSRWQQILDYSHLAIMQRPGTVPTPPPEVAAWLQSHQVNPSEVRQRACGGVVRLQQPPLAVSSTAIRDALRQGNSVQCLLQPRVIEYIHAHELYGTDSSPQDPE